MNEKNITELITELAKRIVAASDSIKINMDCCNAVIRVNIFTAEIIKPRASQTVRHPRPTCNVFYFE